MKKIILIIALIINGVSYGQIDMVDATGYAEATAATQAKLVNIDGSMHWLVYHETRGWEYYDGSSWVSLGGSNIFTANGSVPDNVERYFDLMSNSGFAIRDQELDTYFYINHNSLDLRNANGYIRMRTGTDGTYASNNIGDVWTAVDGFGNGYWASASSSGFDQAGNYTFTGNIAFNTDVILNGVLDMAGNDIGEAGDIESLSVQTGTVDATTIFVTGAPVNEFSVLNQSQIQNLIANSGIDLAADYNWTGVHTFLGLDLLNGNLSNVGDFNANSIQSNVIDGNELHSANPATIPSGLPRLDQVQQMIASSTFDDSTLLPLDGSRAMAGNLNMGNRELRKIRYTRFSDFTNTDRVFAGMTDNNTFVISPEADKELVYDYSNQKWILNGGVDLNDEVIEGIANDVNKPSSAMPRSAIEALINSGSSSSGSPNFSLGDDITSDFTITSENNGQVLEYAGTGNIVITIPDDTTLGLSTQEDWAGFNFTIDVSGGGNAQIVYASGVSGDVVESSVSGFKTTFTMKHEKTANTWGAWGNCVSYTPTLNYGPELVPDNSVFLATQPETTTYSGGVWSFVDTQRYKDLQINGNLTVGEVYLIEFTITNFVEGGVRVARPTSTNTETANGNYSYEVTATTDDLYISANITGDNTFDISNISCKRKI